MVPEDKFHWRQLFCYLNVLLSLRIVLKLMLLVLCVCEKLRCTWFLLIDSDLSVSKIDVFLEPIKAFSLLIFLLRVTTSRYIQVWASCLNHNFNGNNLINDLWLQQKFANMEKSVSGCNILGKCTGKWKMKEMLRIFDQLNHHEKEP